MDIAIKQMNTNIGKFERDIKFTKEQKEMNTRIVDTLTEQLKEYEVAQKDYIKHLQNANRS